MQGPRIIRQWYRTSALRILGTICSCSDFNNEVIIIDSRRYGGDAALLYLKKLHHAILTAGAVRSAATPPAGLFTYITVENGITSTAVEQYLIEPFEPQQNRSPIQLLLLL